MQSLYILSLPRSLSTLVYHVARLTLGFDQPSWTTDGEILNPDRVSEHHNKRISAWPKWYFGEDTRAMFDYLDSVISTNGYTYKDVVQPFIVCKWIKSKRMPLLKINRQLADVALSMWEKGRAVHF